MNSQNGAKMTYMKSAQEIGSTRESYSGLLDRCICVAPMMDWSDGGN